MCSATFDYTDGSDEPIVINGNVYFIGSKDDQGDFTFAESKCSELGAILAVIPDQATHNQLVAELPTDDCHNKSHHP